MEDTHAVGGEAEPAANSADGFGVCFVDVNAVGGQVLAEEVVGAEAADTGADDEDLHGGRGSGSGWSVGCRVRSACVGGGGVG